MFVILLYLDCLLLNYSEMSIMAATNREGNHMARTAIPRDVKIQVLTEAGYRCAVPTCRNILAIDMHHIVEVNDKGPNEPYNLLALCPTCHALYTRGTISKEAINAWKTM